MQAALGQRLVGMPQWLLRLPNRHRPWSDTLRRQHSDCKLQAVRMCMEDGEGAWEHREYVRHTQWLRGGRQPQALPRW